MHIIWEVLYWILIARNRALRFWNIYSCIVFRCAVSTAVEDGMLFVSEGTQYLYSLLLFDYFVVDIILIHTNLQEHAYAYFLFVAY